MSRNACGIAGTVILLALMLIAAAGCLSPAHPDGTSRASPAITGTPVPSATTAVPVTVRTSPPAPVVMTTAVKPVNTTVKTSVPSPTPTQISEEALNARIVDARNRLESLIDSDVADTLIVYSGGAEECEVKKSKELGYLIDLTSGESTFVKGNYWSIDAKLFTDKMQKDRKYIIIHTHPRMWVTCGEAGVISLYTFSIGDLEASRNLTEQGYHVSRLIAIADMDYRIWPKEEDGWKSEREIRNAIQEIEAATGKSYSYYDPVLDREFYDVDNLMPFLARELDYSYTINHKIIT